MSGNITGSCHDIAAAGVQFSARCKNVAAYGLNGTGAGINFTAGGSYFAAICADFPALGVHVAASGLDESTIGLNVAIANCCFSVGQGCASNCATTHGSACAVGQSLTLHRAGGSYIAGSYVSIGIYGKVPISPFDAAITHKSCSCSVIVVTASSEPFCVHLGTGSTYCYAFAVNLNLIGCTLIKNQGRSRFFGSGHLSGRRNLSFSLLEYIIIIQAQSAISGFHQFGIRCHTAC